MKKSHCTEEQIAYAEAHPTCATRESAMGLRRIGPLKKYWEEFHRWRYVQVYKDLDLPAASCPQLKQISKDLKNVGSDLSAFSASDEFQWFFLWGNDFVAEVSLKDIRRSQGIGEITYGTKREFRGRGAATMAVADVIEEIFERKLLRRLVARVRLDNWASMKVLKRLGFMPEGILRDELLFGGRIFDMVCFGLLSNEWPRGNSSKFKLSPGSPSLP